jgi:hypothetical protein
VDSSAYDFFALLDAVLPVLLALVACCSAGSSCYCSAGCNEAIPNNGLENRHKEETNATISPYHCVVKLAAVVSEDHTRGRQRNRFKTPFIARTGSVVVA